MCCSGHLERRTAGRGSCEGERLWRSLDLVCGALGWIHGRGGRLGDGATRRCIVAQIAPIAITWHRGGRKRSFRVWKREGLEFSQKRAI